MDVGRIFRELGLTVFERGWLSSNNVLFAGCKLAPATLVDTSYGSHAEQTLALVRSGLGDEALGRVVNTHLHSDHCGGNAALQSHSGCEVWLPGSRVDVVARWDLEALTFDSTDQRCDRFSVQRGLSAGEHVHLGVHAWQVVEVGGHDPDAIVFFQPDSGVLIAADALWEDRLAILFPEFDGEPGFAPARRTLDTIEALAPRIVIPGHGRPFTGVARALASSRTRLDRYESDPRSHLRHAARALAMFHLLEHRERDRAELEDWLTRTPVFMKILLGLGHASEEGPVFATELIARLLRDQLIETSPENRIRVRD